jgi:predicted DNA-binding transcriptional regulator AlpA
MITENPFDGREYDGRVFSSRHERNFFIGRLSPRQRVEWLRDHPERWQTREDFLRDLQARAGTDVEAEPPEARSATPLNEVRTSSVSDDSLPAPSEDKRLPDEPATNTMPPPMGNAAAAATADDEITIGERRLIGERRVAAMLGYSQRQLQRWRRERKGPPSTKIGRRVFYEINELKEWIVREKGDNAAVWFTAPRARVTKL